MPRVPISKKLRHEILKRDGFRCQHCGRKTKDGVKLHIDHIVPVARGGTNEPDNLQILCRDCNLGKSDTPLSDNSYLKKDKPIENIMSPIIIARLAIAGLSVLQSLSEVGEMPNIRFKTLGGKVFWSEIANVGGWRVQQNKVFGNYRILDPENYRVAWGGSGAIGTLLEKLPALADSAENVKAALSETQES